MNVLDLLRRMDAKLHKMESKISENLPKCLPRDLLETLQKQHQMDVGRTNKAREVLGVLFPERGDSAVDQTQYKGHMIDVYKVGGKDLYAAIIRGHRTQEFKSQQEAIKAAMEIADGVIGTDQAT